MSECRCPWCNEWFNSLGIMMHRKACRRKLIESAIAHLNGYIILLNEKNIPILAVDKTIKRLEKAI